MFKQEDTISFDWGEGNIEKNWKKHHVSWRECEETFFNLPLLSAPDTKHAKKEARYYCLGITNQGRQLFISFTIRNKSIRVISARDMSKKERTMYEQAIQKNSSP